jgi:hypothetical protein
MATVRAAGSLNGSGPRRNLDVQPSKGRQSMEEAVAIQNIEQMRRLAGIEDVELRDQVAGLRVGDRVRITFLAGTGKAETLSVCITAIRRGTFRGELTASASSPQLAAVRRGSAVTFNRAHIHSVPKCPPGTSHTTQGHSPIGREAAEESGG